MVAVSPSLADYVGTYALYRDVRAATVRQYELAVAALDRWAGRRVTVAELTPELVSRWLRDYAAEVSPATAASKRSQVLVLWRSAADDGLVAAPTRRVRPVKQIPRATEAWTLEEVERLLVACRDLPRTHRCGLPRPTWWDLAIRIAWDTGLRWSDQIALRSDDARRGRFTVVQSKTRRPVSCGLSDTTLAVLEDTLRSCPRPLATPWPATQEAFLQQFRRLVAAARIRPGTWKFLRRGSATDVELQVRGDASTHLGHAPGSRVADTNYLAHELLAASRARPRPLSRGVVARTDSM
jgi:integrase